MKAILETRDLVKYYGKGDNLVKAIDHTDLIIEPGEFTAIVPDSQSVNTYAQKTWPISLESSFSSRISLTFSKTASASAACPSLVICS